MDKLKLYEIKLQGCCRNVDSVRKDLEIPLESRVKQVNILYHLTGAFCFKFPNTNASVNI